MTPQARITRRKVLALLGLGTGGLVVYGCATPSPSATAPAATAAPPAAQPPAAAPTAQPPAAQPPTAAPTAAPAAAIKRGGTIKIILSNDFQGMWPLTAPGWPPRICFETLVAWRQGADGRWGPQPHLAESWEQTDKAATFKLRKGVKFHDGSDLNAEVVKWNLEMFMTHPKSLVKQDLKVVDAQRPADVVDEYTVRLNLTGPSGSLLPVLSDGHHTSYIFSRAAHEKLGDAGMEKQAVGTGPFMLEKWEPGNQTTVTRFDQHWGKGADGKALPYADKITYRVLPDESVRALELLSGAADFADYLRPADIPRIKADPKLVYLQADWLSAANRLVFSGTNPPFKDNVKLRQAVLYAIDREAIARALGGASGIPSKYDIRPGQLGYDESLPYYWLDQQKAKQLLTEAGYPSGIDVTLTVISREVDVQQAQMLQQMLGQVGIRVTIEALERTAAVAKVRQRGDFQMYTQKSANLTDPDSYLTMVWDSKSPAPFQRVDIPEMDKALAEARASFDPKVRQEKYKVVQQIMFDTAWWGFLWLEPWTYAWNNRLKNVQKMWESNYQEGPMWLDS